MVRENHSDILFSILLGAARWLSVESTVGRIDHKAMAAYLSETDRTCYSTSASGVHACGRRLAVSCRCVSTNDASKYLRRL